MYNLIEAFINHTWDTSAYSSTEQGYIYAISGIMLIVFTVVMIDLIRDIFRRFTR